MVSDKFDSKTTVSVLVTTKKLLKDHRTRISNILVLQIFKLDKRKD